MYPKGIMTSNTVPYIKWIWPFFTENELNTSIEEKEANERELAVNKKDWMKLQASMKS